MWLGDYRLRHKEYNELALALAGILYDDNTHQAVPAKSQKVEGKLTRILYLAPKGRSTLEIFRNYENELKRAGFQVLYSCSGDKGCGEHGDLMYQFIYREERQLRALPGLEYAFRFPKDQRYLAAKLARPEGDVYVSLYMAVNGFDIPQWMYPRITRVGGGGGGKVHGGGDGQSGCFGHGERPRQSRTGSHLRNLL
jgi:hypothetical protein